MTEYLYDAIHAINGEAIDIAAQITDADGNNIESGCSLAVFDDNCSLFYKADGVYANGMWTFVIPAEVSQNMRGRYWYRVMNADGSLNFNAPIYLN